MIVSRDGEHYDWPKHFPGRESLGVTSGFFVVTEITDERGGITGDWAQVDSFDEACDLGFDDASSFADSGFKRWLCLVVCVAHGGLRVASDVVANKGYRWGGQGGEVDPVTIHRSIGACAGHLLRQIRQSSKGSADVTADGDDDDDEEDTQLAPDDRFDAERDANGPARVTNQPEDQPSPPTDSKGQSSCSTESPTALPPDGEPKDAGQSSH